MNPSCTCGLNGREEGSHREFEVTGARLFAATKSLSPILLSYVRVCMVSVYGTASMRRGDKKNAKVTPSPSSSSSYSPPPLSRAWPYPSVRYDRPSSSRLSLACQEEAARSLLSDTLLCQERRKWKRGRRGAVRRIRSYSRSVLFVVTYYYSDKCTISRGSSYLSIRTIHTQLLVLFILSPHTHLICLSYRTLMCFCIRERALFGSGRPPLTNMSMSGVCACARLANIVFPSSHLSLSLPARRRRKEGPRTDLGIPLRLSFSHDITYMKKRKKKKGLFSLPSSLHTHCPSGLIVTAAGRWCCYCVHEKIPRDGGRVVPKHLLLPTNSCPRAIIFSGHLGREWRERCCCSPSSHVRSLLSLPSFT